MNVYQILDSQECNEGPTILGLAHLLGEIVSEIYPCVRFQPRYTRLFKRYVSVREWTVLLIMRPVWLAKRLLHL
jgi:hypothetical protein